MFQMHSGFHGMFFTSVVSGSIVQQKMPLRTITSGLVWLSPCSKVCNALEVPSNRHSANVAKLLTTWCWVQFAQKVFWLQNVLSKPCGLVSITISAIHWHYPISSVILEKQMSWVYLFSLLTLIQESNSMLYFICNTLSFVLKWFRLLYWFDKDRKTVHLRYLCSSKDTPKLSCYYPQFSFTPNDFNVVYAEFSVNFLN